LKVLGIVGLDYCGSTVVSNVLSGLPGTVNVGESHWILDRNLRCKECGKAPCPVFHGTLLDKLKSADIENDSWWEIISLGTGAELIVSSDKLPKHYDRFGVPNYLIFLYKDPRANIFSWCKRKFEYDLSDAPSIISTEHIEIGINWWVNITIQMADWLEKQKSDVSVVSLENFTINTREMVRGISSWLAMEYDPSAIDYWNRELHYIGGNHSVKRMKPNQHFYNKIAIDERWRESISPQDSERIRNSNEIWALIDRIKEFSER